MNLNQKSLWHIYWNEREIRSVTLPFWPIWGGCYDNASCLAHPISTWVLTGPNFLKPAVTNLPSVLTLMRNISLQFVINVQIRTDKKTISWRMFLLFMLLSWSNLKPMKRERFVFHVILLPNQQMGVTVYPQCHHHSSHLLLGRVEFNKPPQARPCDYQQTQCRACTDTHTHYKYQLQHLRTAEECLFSANPAN